MNTSTREIKFRAWDDEKKEMGEVTSLNFYNEYMWVDETPMTGNRLPLEGTPLMQYTGLKDKNGKEIYEGDLLKYLAQYPHGFQEKYPWKKSGRVCGPVVSEDGWLYADRKYKGEEMLLFKDSANEYEIIGNIYENPELLNHD